jgi:SAM-dependent methyltransferase
MSQISEADRRPVAKPDPIQQSTAVVKRALIAILGPIGLEEPARRAWRRLRGRDLPADLPEHKCQGETSIRMDMVNPYGDTGEQSVQLGGNAEDLYWFRDGVLDYVYSSHLLEDYVDTEAVLREWLRVLRPGGRLIIFCPDEPVYRKHCLATGQRYNTHHIHADFSLEKVKRHLEHIGGTRVIHEVPLIDVYSWELVSEKVG